MNFWKLRPGNEDSNTYYYESGHYYVTSRGEDRMGGGGEGGASLESNASKQHVDLTRHNTKREYSLSVSCMVVIDSTRV